VRERLAALHARDEQLSEQIARSAAYRERQRVRAQIVALENGTLSWLEERADLPERDRTPPELAQSLHISLSSANDRLKRLWRAGVVERDAVFRSQGMGAGRRIYSYRMKENQ
jgi:response regulator of citrate/malate metabolism